MKMSVTYQSQRTEGFLFKDISFNSIYEMGDYIMNHFGQVLSNQKRWFTTIDPEINYRTGESRLYSFHPEVGQEDKEKLFDYLNEKGFII